MVNDWTRMRNPLFKDKQKKKCGVENNNNKVNKW